ncbi:hypothetical protein YC2023_016929 [Brassica napus]
MFGLCLWQAVAPKAPSWPASDSGKWVVLITQSCPATTLANDGFYSTLSFMVVSVIGASVSGDEILIDDDSTGDSLAAPTAALEGCAPPPKEYREGGSSPREGNRSPWTKSPLVEPLPPPVAGCSSCRIHPRYDESSRRYWHISDIPLVVNEWSPESALQPPDLSAIPIWIDLKGVPSMLFSHKALKCLSRAAGKFVKLHPSTEKCVRLDVARVLVEIDLHKLLVEKINFVDKDGVQVVIDVCYPWLPPRCNICNSLGHKGESCNSRKIKVL